MCYFSPRKSTSWHTALRLRKKSEKKDKDGKREGKLENGYRKSREGLSNKVSVKVSPGMARNPHLSGGQQGACLLPAAPTGLQAQVGVRVRAARDTRDTQHPRPGARAAHKERRGPLSLTGSSTFPWWSSPSASCSPIAVNLGGWWLPGEKSLLQRERKGSGPGHQPLFRRGVGTKWTEPTGWKDGHF